MSKARQPLSLQARLTVSLVIVLGLSLPIFAFALFEAYSRALVREFDDRLIDDAKSIAAMVAETNGGLFAFEAGDLDDFAPGPDAAYYEVWLEDESVFSRSLSLGTGELGRGPLNGAAVVVLPDGRPGRSITNRLAPKHAEAHAHRLVTVTVARSTTDLDSTLATLQRALGTTLLMALILAVVAAMVAIRAGLGPLRLLSSHVDTITAERLDYRLPTDAVPSELTPTVHKVNELLGRIEEAFAHERQFTADVSHELRTPLAGLKATLEVGARQQRDVGTYQEIMRDGLQIVDQLQGLIEKLLLLARAGAGQMELKPVPTSLKDLVDDCFGPVSSDAERRRLSFENRVDPVTLHVDRALLRMVVSNLINNAVSYTEAGGQIVIEGDATALRVKDSGPPIPEQDLSRIFGAFVRLEASRANTGEHCGIGLALVRALCGMAKMTVEARNEGRWVTFEVRFHAPVDPLEAQPALTES